MSKSLALAIFLAAAAPVAAEMQAGTHVINAGVGGAAPMTDIDTSPAGGGLKRVGAGGVWAGTCWRPWRAAGTTRASPGPSSEPTP